jgi:transposase-like protein
MSAELTQERPEPRTYTDYSTERKAEALALLDANAGNIKRTANETGIDHATLRYWIQNRERFREFQPQQTLDLAQRFENNVHLALNLAESKASEASYAQLMTGAAIATDKMQLLRNQPTSITQHVNSESLTVVLQQVLNEITTSTEQE